MIATSRSAIGTLELPGQIAKLPVLLLFPPNAGDSHDRIHHRLDRRGRGRTCRDRRAATRDPCRSGNRQPMPAHHRKAARRARRPAARNPRIDLDHRVRRDPARRRRQWAHACCCAATWTRCRCPRRPGSSSPATVPNAMHACGHDCALLDAGRRRARAVGAQGPAPRHGRLHVPARRGRPSRRALHDRGRAARHRAPRQRVRAPHRSQHARRRDPHAPGAAARLDRRAQHHGQGRGRPRRDAARLPRSDPGRRRDRHRAVGVHRAPDPGDRPRGAVDHQDRGGLAPTISCPAKCR